MRCREGWVEVERGHTWKRWVGPAGGVGASAFSPPATHTHLQPPGSQQKSAWRSPDPGARGTPRTVSICATTPATPPQPAPAARDTSHAASRRRVVAGPGARPLCILSDRPPLPLTRPGSVAPAGTAMAGQQQNPLQQLQQAVAGLGARVHQDVSSLAQSFDRQLQPFRQQLGSWQRPRQQQPHAAGRGRTQHHLRSSWAPALAVRDSARLQCPALRAQRLRAAEHARWGRCRAR